jgi:site-specific recombinase XerD
MPETFASSLDRFLSSKKVSVRPRTYEQYQYLAQQILRGAAIVRLDQTPLEEVTLEGLQSLVAILDDRAHFQALGETTVKKMVKFIKATFAWCQRRKWIVANPALDLHFRRVHAQETQPFQTDEVLALLSVKPTTPSEFRDLAMWFMFADTGLRCQEPCQLRQTDLVGNELVISNGKGGKRRSVSLGEAALRVIREYLDTYRPSGEEFLFLTDEGWEMKPRHVAKRLELWAKKAGVKNAAPHRFRATFATQFVLKEGNDLIKLQALLGHSTLDMSRRYVKMAMEEEARLANSARSVVDQLLSGEWTEPVEQVNSPAGLVSPLQTSNMPSMGFPANAPDVALLLGMFQMFAGMMNAMLQTQPGAAQIPAFPAVVSGGPMLLPQQNPSAREG